TSTRRATGRRGRAHAVFLRIHDRINLLRVLAEKIDADTAQVAGRQPGCYFLEGFAAVRGSVNGASWSPGFDGAIGVDVVFGDRVAHEAVELVALPLPGGNQERVGFCQVHGNVDHAGLVVHKKDFLPRLSAVGGLVKTPVGIGTVKPAKGANVNNVG